MKTVKGSNVIILDGGLEWATTSVLLTRSGLNIWLQGVHLRGHVQTEYRTYPALVRDTYTRERRVDS